MATLTGLPPPPPRRICVCVDDFGLHPGVNDAVAALAGLRRVQAVGAMVGGPAWRAGVALLRRLGASGVEVGLHLDLTEHPLRAMPRRSLAGLIAAGAAGRLPQGPLQAEVAAQLDAFEQGLGRAPDFIDGHRHVHQLPAVARVLLGEIGARYGAARPWLRNTQPPALRWASPAAWPPAAKQWLIASLGARGLAAGAARQGLRQNRHLLGVYDFRGGPLRYRALLAGWLRAAADGDLLMCHPARSAPDGDPIGAARRAEFDVLGGPVFAELLARQQVVLAPLATIVGAAGAAT